MLNSLYCTWVAIYKDGSSVPEIGERNLNSFYDIDQDKIEKFLLVSVKGTTVTLNIDNGKKPIEYRTCRQARGSPAMCVSRTIGWESAKHRLTATYNIEEDTVIICKEDVDINEHISGELS